MTSDPTIAQQVPSYFLQEASELLQQIEHELQTLRQEFGVQKMHSLMRAAHTLKGAAASVGLEAIKTTTHSLEDAFKALCVPDATLTTTVEGLIFEAYDCLQLLLSAQLAETPTDESGVLDRMAAVVTKLQENLGDQFGQDGYLPTSTELGFDMTQSIFEMGVTQRLDALENALKNPKPDQLKSLLKSQAEVFFGLAESLSLPGFGEIAQATLVALNNRPNQVVQIATLALKDYRAGQTSVLQGDRTQGGTPSLELKKLGTKYSSKKETKSSPSKPPKNRHKSSKPSWFRLLWPQQTHSVSSPKPIKKLSPNSNPHPKKSPTAHTDRAETQTALAQNPGSIWETKEVLALPEVATIAANQQSPTVAHTSGPKPLIPAKPKIAKPIAAPSNPTLRVSINHLEQLNYTIGELLTQQNQQALYNERLTTSMKTLLARLAQQQQQLHKLQRQTIRTSAAWHLQQPEPTEQQFDALELDHYSEQHLLVQASLDTMVQQMESAEAIELFVRQSNQTLEKQQRLMDDLRETMLEARMQPLENLLQRFHQLLTRLSSQHGKPVILKVLGGDVLVDKAIVDKLYDPLLHLVRNAFDHGIEKPDVRKQYGKAERGQILISARQVGRHLVIQIQDNGQGLNLKAIRQKAVENQLITPVMAQQLTPNQIANLIFEPDLSTAARLNDLSGRGVGLDAVRAQIHALRGTVTVTHRSGHGTCFTLKIPANLTIAKLLLCQAGEKLYALMTDTIEQILVPKLDQLNIQNNRKILSLQIEDKAQLIPIISLSDALIYNGVLPNPYQHKHYKKPDTSSPIILIRHKNRFFGLEIDKLLGEQELVIRSLGNISTAPEYVYGCSILSNGRLSLVIDGAALTLKILQPSAVNPITEKTESLPARPQLQPMTPVPTKQSILIVDDSITVRNTLAQGLQKAGFLVIQAKDGEEALQKLDQNQVRAILCDLEMPGMNGFEFLRVRQRMPQVASIPTIMLTSRTGEKHRQLTRELGATDYLTKPYLMPQLLETLSSVLEPVASVPSVRVN